MPVIETALTRLLGIEHPILLAPMGSAAGGRLAAAVTNAGGLGLVDSGEVNAAAIRGELTEAGNARVGIGFILWALEKNPEALDVALEAGPAAVMSSFGDSTPFTGRIKDAGCKIICQVQTLAQAREAAAAGADVIIAQGATPAAIPALREVPWGLCRLWSMPSLRSRWSRREASPMAAAWLQRSHWAPRAFRWAPGSPHHGSRCGASR